MAPFRRRIKDVARPQTRDLRVIHRTYQELLSICRREASGPIRGGGERDSTGIRFLGSASGLGRRGEEIRRPVSRVLCRPHCCGRGGHSSGPSVAERFSRPTRTPRACDCPTGEPARRPYSVLLQAGLAMPSRSPGPRWALTPPFHPYPIRRSGGLLSVALSLRSPSPDVIRHRVSVEPGLSSPYRLSTLIKRGCPANWHRLINRDRLQLPPKYAASWIA